MCTLYCCIGFLWPRICRRLNVYKLANVHRLFKAVRHFLMGRLVNVVPDHLQLRNHYDGAIVFFFLHIFRRLQKRVLPKAPGTVSPFETSCKTASIPMDRLWHPKLARCALPDAQLLLITAFISSTFAETASLHCQLASRSFLLPAEPTYCVNCIGSSMHADAEQRAGCSASPCLASGTHLIVLQ